MATTPLAVLDLVPISSGSWAAGALRNSIDLAQAAERLGYARYWFAEHHLNPGVAGTSPAVVLALTAAATTTIRIGSGAVQMGHRTALATVEEFGLIDALHPGRLDLGLGRSGGRPLVGAGRRAGRCSQASGRSNPPRRPAPPGTGSHPAEIRFQAAARLAADRDAEGAAAAPRRTVAGLRRAGRRRPRATAGNVPLARRRPRARRPRRARAGAGLDPGQQRRGERRGGRSNGLRFAANYHVSPATVLEAVDGYRAAFRPSADLDRPYVSVSADVVVAEDEETARELATGYGLWVRSIRSGEGAIEFPTPRSTARRLDRRRPRAGHRPGRHPVRRLRGQVADKLEQLRDATGADKLGIAFDSLTVRVEGDLDIRGFFGFDDAVRPGLSRSVSRSP